MDMNENKAHDITTSDGSGHRRTPQREVILRVLRNANKHITAEDIFEQARKEVPGISPSTVYRSLEKLKRSGQVAETNFGEHRLLYHHIDKGHHHHLVCRACGRMFDIDEDVLDSLTETLIKEYGFIRISNTWPSLGVARPAKGNMVTMGILRDSILFCACTDNSERISIRQLESIANLSQRYRHILFKWRKT